MKKEGMADVIKAEWKQMTFLHKVRFTVCINAMLLFSWAFLYSTASKIVFNLVAYHYATNELYRSSMEMQEYITSFYDVTFYAILIYDFIIYILVMIGLMLLASRRTIFSNEKDVMCVEMRVKDSWREYLKPKKQVEEEPDVNKAIDELMEKKKI